jgi:uncharacterized protein (TIGR03000 family)
MRIAVAFLLATSAITFAQTNCAPAGNYNGYYGLPGSPGVVVGPSWGYWPGWGWGPGWGWWNNGVNGSFYSNGLSLYGQPLPQQGLITPGFFGGSDQARNYWNTPPYIGLGWGGYRSPLPNVHGAAKDFQQNPLPEDWNGPRFGSKKVKERYAQAKADPLGESYRQMADVNRANYGLRVFIRLPDDNCMVYLQGQPMGGTGRERLFESPALPAGTEYKYTVTVKLPDDKTAVKEVSGKPGDTLTVDFTAP